MRQGSEKKPQASVINELICSPAKHPLYVKCCHETGYYCCLKHNGIRILSVQDGSPTIAPWFNTSAGLFLVIATRPSRPPCLLPGSASFKHNAAAASMEVAFPNSAALLRRKAAAALVGPVVSCGAVGAWGTEKSGELEALGGRVPGSGAVLGAGKVAGRTRGTGQSAGFSRGAGKGSRGLRGRVPGRGAVLGAGKAAGILRGRGQSAGFTRGAGKGSKLRGAVIGGKAPRRAEMDGRVSFALE